MPELPEIETVKLQLQKVLVGQKLLKSNFPEVTGKTVKEIKRLGKVLLINFDSSAGSELNLGFHFKMTGQLIYIPHPSPLLNSGEGKRIVGGHPTEDFWNTMPGKHTRLILEFNNGKLYFNDQRKFGWVMINPKFVDKLGPEALEITTDKFLKLLGKLKKPIKLAIMDQEIISGVGNIYANDALWESRINPRFPVNQLSVEQLTSLLEKLKLVLREGIKYGGATASDAKYIDLHGLGGHYQEHFRVYDREGQKCHRGDGVIEKFVLGGRGTYWCPRCQS
ncbi:MAG: Formamidopyrimidine-DNA glycosylase [Candidatus Amesbacteria bacterium GW2011_GWA2_42_12]|uniref:Formamidopyrimidine-DNA glycosylase n=1 Tax=Candidatus Amesbacteria bacterium GW2011_GWA2_42_12 TaxID=1618356 RepID=A0A0G1AFS1_9BACT|nr:MAG: Formamidopyrimidine-DNA glycosylase [Candidatus Amesbacteria bacterium GW2011_GWA2_42_12]